MDYSELIYTARYYFPVVTAIFFLFTLLFSDSQHKVHSFVICLVCLIYYLAPDLPQANTSAQYLANFTKQLSVMILLNGVGALAMTMFLFIDKLAWQHALIYAFAVVCNVVLLYDLTIASSMFSNFFYAYFDELIILIGLLQIMVSHDGFVRAFSNVREYILRIRFYIYCFRKGMALHKKGEGRA